MSLAWHICGRTFSFASVRFAFVSHWQPAIRVCLHYHRFPRHVPFLASAWQVDRKWQQHEPGECRPVISRPIMKAITSLCLLWEWHRWLGVTLVGFLGMLHPAEFAPLLRSDLLLPQESLMDNSIFYVHIRQPKTALFARRQHCKVDDLLTLGFIEKIYGHLGPDEPLFQGGMSAYCRRWNVVLTRLQGIPCSQPDGCHTCCFTW